ncbi:MAG TPA: 7-carboxy-7-deazaguanine synthase QueE [Thermoanaerobaculia bacterium]|nr:7-carboxy-7-deazaguanine synthase QueE [Thermoanaerobaculia bacterium]
MTRPAAAPPEPSAQPPAASRSADPRRAPPAAGRLRVTEIFHSIQGESTFAGRPCVFVRLTGCQMRCRWCDTEYAFHGGEWRSREEVVAEVAGYGCSLVEVTGGEPLLQPGTLPLLAELCDRGYEVLLETGGGLDVSEVDPRVRRIVDVKCPGSGEAEANRWENLDLLRPTDEVKLVIAGEADYLWARRVVEERRLAERCPVLFSPVAGELAPQELAEWILRDRLPVRFQLQLHKLLWGDQPGR